MLRLENAEARRACALITALDEHEITFQEFEDAVKPLTPELLQVTSTILHLRSADQSKTWSALIRARHLCTRLAASTRNIN